MRFQIHNKWEKRYFKTDVYAVIIWTWSHTAEMIVSKAPKMDPRARVTSIRKKRAENMFPNIPDPIRVAISG